MNRILADRPGYLPSALVRAKPWFRQVFANDRLSQSSGNPCQRPLGCASFIPPCSTNAKNGISMIGMILDPIGKSVRTMT